MLEKAREFNNADNITYEQEGSRLVLDAALESPRECI
jgi:hypothetical protein